MPQLVPPNKDVGFTSARYPPLTIRELARLAAYLDEGHSLHRDQQRAVVAELLRLRGDGDITTPAATATVVPHAAPRDGVRPSGRPRR